MSKRNNSVFRRDEKTEMCRVVLKENGTVEYKAPKLENTEIDGIIEEDKRYGTFKPANGEYFTYKVLNEDEEVTNEEVLNIIRYAFLRYTRRLDIKFKPAKLGEIVDFRLEFRTVESDPEGELTKNTLMYHYFPINDVNHRLRGLCVVNKAYYWTGHGNGILLHIIDPDNYPEPTELFGQTFDLDQVYGHELGHGLGLPHAKEGGHMMSPNYGIMAEFLSELDVLRMEAKYPKREMEPHILKRWLKWLIHASDR